MVTYDLGRKIRTDTIIKKLKQKHRNTIKCKDCAQKMLCVTSQIPRRYVSPVKLPELPHKPQGQDRILIVEYNRGLCSYPKIKLLIGKCGMVWKKRHS